MKRLTVVFLLFLATPIVQAGTLTPELEAAIENLGPGELVDIIVRCSDSVVPAAFTDDDLTVRRERLTTALKEKANACVNSLSAQLDEPLTQLWTINGFATAVPVGSLEGLVRRPGVESITLDAEVAAPAGSGGSSASPEWNIDAVRAPELWAQGYDGTGVVVATLDTGVDLYHPDIGPKWRGGANSWFDPNGQHATPYDANGHGTHTMGLIVGGDAGGSAIGVAPGARWIAVKIFDDKDRSRLSRIHQGFQWVLDPDGDPGTNDAADIVNNSWYLQSTVNQCNTEFTVDIAVLKAAEIAVVFSAGNAGPNPDTSVSPSNDPESLAVGAVDVTWTVGDFSSRGASACDGGFYPGVSAPGVDVRTADRTFGGLFPDSYAVVTGTSFAAPHAAGGMAVLESAMEAQGISASVALLESAIDASAVDWGLPGPDNDYGAGVLDLAESYAWLLANAGEPQPGDLQFGASAYSVDESAGSIAVSVTRTNGNAGDVTVDYATSDETATAGVDYEAASGTLTLLDGETSGTFAVTILNDAVYEGDEDLSLSLSNPTGGAMLGSPSNAVLTIVEPPPGQLQLSAGAYGVDENGGSISVSVTRTNGSAGDVTVDYATSDGTATAGADYESVAGTLTLLDGETSGTFTVTIFDDAVYEGDEDLNVSLTNPTGGAVLGSTDTAVLTIADDESPPSVDNDGDGYDSDVDCNDSDAAIHPGAQELKHDGIDQDCNGYDLTIDVTKAQYHARQDKLTVEATSDLGSAAALQLEGFGPMSWNGKKSKWSRSVKPAGGHPGIVIVSGVEGSESAAVP